MVSRITCLLLLLGMFAAEGCKESGPEMNEKIRAKADPKNKDELGEKDQTPPQTRQFEQTDEVPDIDLSLEVTQSGGRMDMHIMAADAKGLEVCTVKVSVHHRVRDDETGDWERDGKHARILFPRIAPGEIAEITTAVRDAEFPDIFEVGDPEAWEVVLDSWAEVGKPPGWTPPKQAS